MNDEDAKLGYPKDGKNGPNTQGYIDSVMHDMHIEDYIMTPDGDDDKMLVQMGAYSVKPSHYKKTMAFKSEIDVLLESNPIVRRNTVNTDVNIRFSLKLIELILKLSKNTISEKEFNDIKKFHTEISELIKNRSLDDDLDIDYINEKLRKKSNDML